MGLDKDPEALFRQAFMLTILAVSLFLLLGMLVKWTLW